MKFYPLVPLLLLILTSCTPPQKANDISIGKTDSLSSKILGENRKIWVYVPDGGIGSKKKYPVLYLLDGEAHFSSVVGMIQQLSSVNGNTVCPEMIVVGIPNTDRTRDLTPTKSMLGPDGDVEKDFTNSGGGEKFISFIEKELMPHINSTYPAAPYKVFVGHSFGGLTVMNTLIHHPEMFDAYVAIDPSMWWDKKKLLMQAKDVFKEKKFERKSLFMGIANTMPGGMDTLQVRLDTTGRTNHIRSIISLKDILKDNPANGLQFSYKYYKDDDHGSVPLITEYDAFHYLFGFYKIPPDLNSLLGDIHGKTDPVPALTAHYAEVSKHIGYTILPPESIVNEYSYYYMQQGAKDKSFSMLSLNIHNYPDSPNVYDSMGDYYSQLKDKAKAIENYKKALELKDDPETRKKMDKLKG
ncbi:MAG TPA: alpha/beta hydrolase-fold protein [Mucilaginibacter sp.]|nr:alpha/beta hydrolase-fold protein [Mucilaginibacter sp.]